MAAKRGSCRDAGVFRGAEGAHGPGLAAVMRRKKGQQVLRPRGLARAVAAQHEEQEPGRLGHHALGAQRLPAAQVGHVVEDDLHHDLVAHQAREKVRQSRIADLGLVDLAQADGDGLGPQRLHHGDLLGRAVDAGRLAGDLHHHVRAHGLAHHAPGFAVAVHIQAVAPLGVADVHVDHGRAGIQAGACRGGQRLRCDRQGSVVGRLLVGAVGGHGDDQRVAPLRRG